MADLILVLSIFAVGDGCCAIGFLKSDVSNI
jgi:hypothetical protein